MERPTIVSRRLIARAALLAMTMLAVLAAPASASFGIEPGSFSSQLSTTVAGAHPDLDVEFAVTTNSEGSPEGPLKDVTVDLPPGLVGNAGATPTCEIARVLDTFQSNPCPADTVVGYAEGTIFFPNSGPYTAHSFIYNVPPYLDQPAGFAAFPFFPFRLDTSVNSDGDYSIRVRSDNLTEGSPIIKVRVMFFGVPADHNGPPNGGPVYGNDLGQEIGGPGGGARIALMQNPTKCDGSPLLTKIGVASWEHPDIVAHDTASTGAITGCDNLVFEPTITVRPDNFRAGAPAGYAVDLGVPQNVDPSGLATPTLEDAKVVLPPGVTLSPALAAGLDGCSDDEVGLHRLGSDSCPPASKIGSLSLTSPLLPGPLDGSIYVGDPLPGNRYRAFFSLHGYGINVKLEGRVDLDPRTAQITATFLDNPQLPFSNMHVAFKGGPNAALLNPASCGTKTVATELRSHAGQVATPSASFKIDEGCAPRGFEPKMSAGTVNPAAGQSSPFSLRVTQADGEQNLSRVEATLPEGLLAKLGGVPLCGDAQAVSGACPVASQVGTATVGVGAGPNPLYVPEAGKAPTGVYLAGPYKSAPYSLVVKVPAQAGPFDLGTVTVRNALEVDPVTTQVTAVSDPLPQILEGVPIAYRDLRIDVDRQGFTINPTSCAPSGVSGTAVSAEGASAALSSRFQVGDCERLGFKPKLSLKLSGPTHRSAHPKLRAVLTARKGDANIARAQVTLPKTEFLENAHIQTVCTRVQFAAKACPAKSIYGYAKAWSPLLDKPLQGPVYLRSSSHELPDLVASLDGQIHVDLQGRIDAKNARIRNTFDFVPDAPVSKFVLTMQGGKKGLLVNNTELCRAVPRARVALDGQNGKVADSNPVARTDCGTGRKAKK